MSDVVYMPLLDEGVECWRPVHGGHVKDDIYDHLARTFIAATTCLPTAIAGC